MNRILVAGVVALVLPLTALAGATVESLSGIAQVGDKPVMRGDRLTSPTALLTHPGTQVYLKFDDGMQIVLHEKSVLRIVDYRHTSSSVTDRAELELLRGAARVVTGTIARDNPKQFFFRVPHTQLTVERGADFTVALVNPAYISVHAGAVQSSNGFGTFTLGQGSLTTVASNATGPVAITASQLPASASAAMSNLSVATVAAPAGGAATGMPTTAGARTGVGLAVPAVIVGLGIAAAAIAGTDDDPSTSSHSATTHH